MFLELIPIVIFLSSTILSLVYLFDVLYNIRKTDNLKVLTRHRTLSIWLFVSTVFIIFFNIGLMNSTLISWSWVFAALLWFVNVIVNNRAVRKLKESQK